MSGAFTAFKIAVERSQTALGEAVREACAFRLPSRLPKAQLIQPVLHGFHRDIQVDEYPHRRAVLVAKSPEQDVIS